MYCKHFTDNETIRDDFKAAIHSSILAAGVPVKHFLLCITTAVVILLFFFFMYTEASYKYISGVTKIPKFYPLPTGFNSNSLTKSQPRNTSINNIGFQDEILESIPDFYIIKNTNKPTEFNKTCAKFPNFLDMEYNNIYWQSLRSSNGTFHLLNAYLDIRKQNKFKKTIRILGVVDRIQPPSTVCQLWYNKSKKPKFSNVREYSYIFHKSWGGYKDGYFNPYLISCDIPGNGTEIPVSVSLVQRQCDNAKNNLRIIYNPAEKKRNFVVCVKGLNFPFEDYTAKLTEWIELNHLLGAEEFFLYAFTIHPNIIRLLNYYKSRKLVQVKPITLAGIAPNEPHLQERYLKEKVTQRRLQEVITLNDCFYKNIYRYKYVLLVDTDEVVIPKDGTWYDLIDLLIKKHGQKIDSFCARNVYFLDTYSHNHEWFEGIPKDMHVLQHIYRSVNYTGAGAFVKCFHSTENVLTLHNHFPRACLNKCTSKSIDTSDGHMQHYRDTCVKEIKCDKFKDYVIDKGVWRFKNELIERFNKTISEISLFM